MDKLEHIQNILARIEKDICKKVGREYDMNDFEMYSFTQIWPTIDTGFSQKGNEASTLAYTFVFIPLEKSGLDKALVYFDDKFAYAANPTNKNFKHDLEKKSMVGVWDSIKYK